MHVLLTGDTAGGVFTFVQQLAKGLAERNCDVTLATFGPVPFTSPKRVRWFHHCSKLEWQPQPWAELEMAGEWLEQLVERERPDLLHFNTLCHGDRGWDIPLVTTVHSCVPTWWAAMRKTELPEEWHRYCEAVRPSLGAATAVTFPSWAFFDAFRNAWCMKLPETFVVKNGLEADESLPREKEAFAFSAGRFWDEAKNIRILERLAETAKWPIYVAGEGRAAKCRPLGPQSSVAMKNWYARAAIFISPAIYEPFGLSILEAATASCALLLNDIPSLRENWSGAALFSKPDEMDLALEALIENVELRSRLQEEALTRSRAFNEVEMTSRYLEVYEHARSCACIS